MLLATADGGGSSGDSPSSSSPSPSPSSSPSSSELGGLNLSIELVTIPDRFFELAYNDRALSASARRFSIIRSLTSSASDSA